ncbi:MAG TPA: 4Fe-4S cluster-binding domain-containing protein [Candidatus Brocadiia bacterium]|nr:4Fe-4S cluster-binding domain-containing protein [Candidatus Brocadiia bacterium]
MPQLNPIILPPDCNYFAIFLTLDCPLACPYCINHHISPARRRKTLPASIWIPAINRVTPREDLPVTLQGGEPGVYPDFLELINGIREDMPIDILTNLQFDLDGFIRAVRPERLRRKSPYASIRVSYHPGQVDPVEFLDNVRRLQNLGYHIGVWAVEHPAFASEVAEIKGLAAERGIDFRTKEFLGYHDGKLYGTYRWKDSCAGKATGETVQCRTTELIIDPAGAVYRCHSDLYAAREPVGDLLYPDFRPDFRYRDCNCYGLCNPCDVKVKTNRFQVFGHTSVDIRFRDRRDGDKHDESPKS